jgi:hypothetical protein
MRIPLLICMLFLFANADTLNKRIYQQAVASPASVQNKQIGVNTTADASLGFKMWFGKDSDGVVNQFLCKSQKALMLNVSSDTNRVKAIYSARDTGVFCKKDTGYIVGLKSDRLYFGLLSGTKSTFDTSSVNKVLSLQKTSGTYTTDGMIWNDSTESNFENFTNGIKGTFNRCLFAQDIITLDSNSNAEVKMRGTDTIHGWIPGADSLPANWFKRSKKLKIIIRGIYSTKATSPGTMEAKLKLNDTVVATTGAVALSNDQTDETWICEGAISCRSVGTTGSLYFMSAMQFSVANVWNQANFYSLTKTINTTIKQRLDFTVQFSLADAKNKVRVIQFELDEIH